MSPLVVRAAGQRYAFAGIVLLARKPCKNLAVIGEMIALRGIAPRKHLRMRSDVFTRRGCSSTAARCIAASRKALQQCGRCMLGRAAVKIE
jgi:hypothetical protein